MKIIFRLAKDLQVKKLSFEVDLRHFSLVSGVGICSTSCAENRNHHHQANLKWIKYCFRQSFATLEMSRRLEPKCVPQLCLGLLLNAPVSYWQFFSLSPVTVPEFLAKGSWAKLPSRFCGGEYEEWVTWRRSIEWLKDWWLTYGTHNQQS